LRGIFPTSLAAAVALAALAVGSAPLGPPAAQAVQRGEIELPLDAERLPPWLLDDDLPEPVRAMLNDAVGHSVSVFDERLEWKENAPTPASLEGKMIVLQTWTRMSPEARRAPIRVQRLVEASDVEDVVVLAVHTPEGADGRLDDYLERRSMDMPIAVDDEGGWLDDLGVWKEPVTIIIDRQGRIRVPGVALNRLIVTLRALDEAEPAEAEAEPTALPGRATRVERIVENEADRAERRDSTLPNPKEQEEREREKEIEEAEFPPHQRVRGANDLQGRKGPPVVAQTWITRPPNMRNKVIVLEFWATWCGPCIAGIPHLNDLQEEFKDSVVIVGVSAEDEGTVRPAVKQHNMRYTIASDPQRRAQKVVGNRGIPHCVVMSADGIVRWQGHPAGLDSGTLRQIVNASKREMGDDAPAEEADPAERFDEYSWVSNYEDATAEQDFRRR